MALKPIVPGTGADGEAHSAFGVAQEQARRRPELWANGPEHQRGDSPSGGAGDAAPGSAATSAPGGAHSAAPGGAPRSSPPGPGKGPAKESPGKPPGP